MHHQNETVQYSVIGPVKNASKSHTRPTFAGSNFRFATNDLGGWEKQKKWSRVNRVVHGIPHIDRTSGKQQRDIIIMIIDIVLVQYYCRNENF
jgi:hypothetical protein